ncbi:hypothetical protein L1286_21370 [Pseudoalteromonas sp. SMS1]|uniref:hypothetical protein n=1 Tax=Pseudoalteromonas sp. SMS1 TaxID=2908894 RepID=UPI001F2AF3B3|nr:hypothetical protein [Pseudoalteromonas sp. SMS1]MCF2860037.1 hypothetical protein [Pseudoalteromonas sp. SMS1]
MNGDFDIIYILILGCEFAFWVLLCAGFAIRYVFNLKKLSAFVLASVPLVDLFLLGFVVIDLSRGESATFAHGLAAAYIGFTIAFGSTLVRWADQWFAHRFGGAAMRNEDVLFGWSAVIDEFKLWFRCIFAVAITYGLLVLIVGFVDNPAKTAALTIWFKMPLFTVFFWFLFGPLWRVVFFKRASKS